MTQDLCPQPDDPPIDVADVVRGAVAMLSSVFRPALVDVDDRMWNNLIVTAVGTDHDPDDVAAAMEAIMRERKESTFPVPALIREEIGKQKLRRLQRLEVERYKRTVHWHDNAEHTHYTLEMRTEADKERLQHDIDAFDKVENYEASGRLFWRAWQEISPTSASVPEKYRITRQ